MKTTTQAARYYSIEKTFCREWIVVERAGEIPSDLPRSDRGTPLAWLSRDVAERVARRLS